MKLLLFVTIFLSITPEKSIPYNIEKRPLPVGRDWARILPKKVGNYILTKFRVHYDTKCAASGEYINGNKIINIGGMIPTNADGSACTDFTNMMHQCVDSDEIKNESGENYTLLFCSDNCIFKYQRKGDNGRLEYGFDFSTYNPKKNNVSIDDFEAFIRLFPY